jgi:ADP-ribose pyrophosphatase
LTKISEGGGVDGENIIVHRVALTDLPHFVQEKRTEGCVMDVKLLMLPGMIA